MFTSFDRMFDFNRDGQLDTAEQAVEYMFLDDMSGDEEDDFSDSEEDEEEDEW